MSSISFQPATLLSIHLGSSGVRSFKVFPLSKNNIQLGRHERCDISLNSEQIADYHAQLFFESEVWQIRALNILAEIVVNQTKVPIGTAVTLSSQTVLKLANLELIFHDGPSHNEHFVQTMLDNSFQSFFLNRCYFCKKHLVTPSVLNCGHDFCALCIDKLLKMNYLCPRCDSKVISLQFIPLYKLIITSPLEATSSGGVHIQESIDQTTDTLALRIDISNLIHYRTLIKSRQLILPDQTLIKLHAELERTQSPYWNSDGLSLLLTLKSGCDCEPRYIDIDAEAYFLDQRQNNEQRCAFRDIKRFKLTAQGDDIFLYICLNDTKFKANLTLWPPANDRLVVTVKIRQHKTDLDVANLPHFTRLFEQILVPPSSPAMMNNALIDPYAADFKVIAKNNEYFVNRQVLAAKSPVFRKMFTHEMVEKETGVIDISINDDNAVVYELLRYIYTDKVIWQEKHTTKLLGFAHMYQMTSLLSSCEHYMGNNLDVESVSPTVSIAAFYSLSCLKTRCFEFIKRNHKAVFSSKNWKQLTIQTPLLVEEIKEKVLMPMVEYPERPEKECEWSRCGRRLVERHFLWPKVR